MVRSLFVKQKKPCPKHAEGFTLIETMVAVSIFAIIVTVGIGALLSLNTGYKITRKDRSLMDGVAGAIERMSREIKTGYNFTCDPIDFSSITVSNAGTDGLCTTFGFFATEGGETKPTIYTVTDNRITVLVDDPTLPDALPVTPDEVTITDLSFTLSESALGGDQPYVVIRIDGTVTENENQIPFSLQTLVTQRFPDTVTL